MLEATGSKEYLRSGLGRPGVTSAAECWTMYQVVFGGIGFATGQVA